MEFLAHIALFMASSGVDMPLFFMGAMTLPTVRLDSSVLEIMGTIDILESDAISRITAISFNNRRSLNDICTSKTLFGRLVSFERLFCRNGSFQWMCKVRLQRPAETPKTAKFINCSNGSNGSNVR